MFTMDNMMDASCLAGSAINIIQSQKLHERDIKNAKIRHQESMDLSTALHQKDMKIAKQTYLMAAFTSLEQHFQQLNADLISSSKESESDMFDQRNQCFQTVILSATIMFSSLVTVIFQGFLPPLAGSFIYVSYSLTSALSFAFLFLSIVLSTEVLLRASSFMYDRATNHTKQLREAIQKTKTMMKRIRIGETQTRPGESKREVYIPKGINSEDFGTGNTSSSSSNYKQARQIAEMREEELQLEWERHEAEVHRYLEEREKINDQTSVLVSADANSMRMSFEQFWRESCKLWGDIAILFFYAGTANLLLAIMIYMWTEFFIVYQNTVGAIIAVMVIGISVVVGIALYFFLRQNNNVSTKIYKDRTTKGSDTDSDDRSDSLTGSDE